MKIARRVALVLGAMLLLAVAIAFLLPRHAVVSRSIEIDAPPAAVFPLVSDLRRFNEWSPWAELDPAAVYTFTGAVDGVGQTLNWTSDIPAVGAGSMTIVALQPNARVDLALDFAGEGGASSSIVLAPEGAGTEVAWRFDSDLGFNPVARYFGIGIDGLVGPDYEKGLARLEAVVEAPQAPDAE